MFSASNEITPERLFTENKSYAASERLAEWEYRHDRHKLPLIFSCSDARVVLPPYARILKSVAIGGDRSAFLSLIRNSNGIVMIAHYDGETALPGIVPSGCGGQDAKRMINKSQDLDPHQALHFVDNYVVSPDPIINALVQARRASQMVQIPVLAVAQDHRTGRNKLLGVFSPEFDIPQTCLPNHETFTQIMNGEQYDPKRIYDAGVPELLLEEPFDFYAEMYHDQRIEVTAAERVVGILSTHNKVQNPNLMFITTDARPGKIRYPAIMGLPNSVFSIRLPISKEQAVHIPEEAIELGIQQANYAISHATEHFGVQGKAFSSMKTVFIEAKTIEMARTGASRLLQYDWMRAYMQKGGKILIGQSEKGTLVKCIELN